MTTAARAAWDGLNSRQQTYLRVLYDQDQTLEESHRSQAARGNYSREPARIWRRIGFNSAGSTIPYQLRAAGVYDSGAGSTLAALTDRGLIMTGSVPGLLSDITVVWVTRAGRAAVRAGAGIRRSSRPKWAVSEWLWGQLANVVHAGEEGLLSADLAPAGHTYLVVDGLGRPYLYGTTTHVPITVGYLSGNVRQSSRAETRYRLTDAGRAHYAERLEDYRELYPDVDAPDLPDSAAPATPSA